MKIVGFRTVTLEVGEKLEVLLRDVTYLRLRPASGRMKDVENIRECSISGSFPEVSRLLPSDILLSWSAAWNLLSEFSHVKGDMGKDFVTVIWRYESADLLSQASKTEAPGMEQ